MNHIDDPVLRKLVARCNANSYLDQKSELSGTNANASRVTSTRESPVERAVRMIGSLSPQERLRIEEQL